MTIKQWLKTYYDIDLSDEKADDFLCYITNILKLNGYDMDELIEMFGKRRSIGCK